MLLSQQLWKKMITRSSNSSHKTEFPGKQYKKPSYLFFLLVLGNKMSFFITYIKELTMKSGFTWWNPCDILLLQAIVMCVPIELVKSSLYCWRVCSLSPAIVKFHRPDDDVRMSVFVSWGSANYPPIYFSTVWADFRAIHSLSEIKQNIVIGNSLIWNSRMGQNTTILSGFKCDEHSSTIS